MKEVSCRKFNNGRAGCSQLLSLIKEQGSHVREEWLFCGEYTRLYSLLLSEFLIKKGLFMRLENPLQIKLPTGIKRDKNDRTDRRDIALYAHRYKEKCRK
jgi:transposase